MVSTHYVLSKCTLIFGRLLHHAAENDLHSEKQHSRKTGSLFSNGTPGRLTALGKLVFSSLPQSVCPSPVGAGPGQGPRREGQLESFGGSVLSGLN